MFRFPSPGGFWRNRPSGAETRLGSATRNPETTWRAGWAQLLRGLAFKVRSWVNSSPPSSSARRKRCLLRVEELDQRIVPSGYPPYASGDMYYLVHDQTLTALVNDPYSPGLLDNDYNPNGDTLRVSAVAGQEANVGAPLLLASGATITVAEDGSFQYIPPDNWSGTDEISYTAANGAGSATATATINVTNEPPYGMVDMYYTQAGEFFYGEAGNWNYPGLLDNDYDGDGDTLTITAVYNFPELVGVAGELPSGATLTVQADGSFIYDPGSFTEGVDYIIYTVSDGLNSTTVQSTIQVFAPPPPPDNPPDLTIGVTYGPGRTITLWGTVTDEQPGGLIVTFTGVVCGQVTTNADGSYSYTAEATGLGEIQADTRDNIGQWSNWAYFTLYSSPPEIVDFYSVAGYPGFTIFRGRVLDESAAGLVVVFGGELPCLQGQTATVGENGTFWIAVEVPYAEYGIVTATVKDAWDLESAVAITYFYQNYVN